MQRHHYALRAAVSVGGLYRTPTQQTTYYFVRPVIAATSLVCGDTLSQYTFLIVCFPLPSTDSSLTTLNGDALSCVITAECIADSEPLINAGDLHSVLSLNTDAGGALKQLLC